MSECICGIDPGEKGGIAFVGPMIQAAFKLPYIGNEVDTDTLAQIVRRFKPQRVMIEDLIIMPGKSSGLKTSGINFGRIVERLYAMGFGVERVHPSKWTKGIPADKRERIRIATMEYPEADIAGDGPADAILIARYGWRMYGIQASMEVEEVG